MILINQMATKHKQAKIMITRSGCPKDMMERIAFWGGERRIKGSRKHPGQIQMHFSVLNVYINVTMFICQPFLGIIYLNTKVLFSSQAVKISNFLNFRLLNLLCGRTFRHSMQMQ